MSLNGNVLKSTWLIMLFIATGCSGGSPGTDTLSFSAHDLEQDYKDIPSGFLLRLSSNLCAQEAEASSYELSADEAASVRLTYQDMDHVDESTVARIFNNESYMIDHITDRKSLLQEDTQITELKMLNLPPTDFVALTSKTAAYPEEFSLDLQAHLNGSLETSNLTPEQAKGAVNQSQASAFKGGSVSQNTVAQNHKGVHQGSSSPTQTTFKGKGPMQTSPGVMQSQGPAQSKGKLATVSQNTVHQGTPSQKGVTQKGAKGKKGASTTALGVEQTANTVTQRCPLATMQHNHLLDHFRPVYASANLTGYNWGYYAHPKVWKSEEHTYFFYPKPTCSAASWCEKDGSS